MSILRLKEADPSAVAVGTPGTDLVDWRTDSLGDLMRRRAAVDPALVLYTFLEDGEARERSMTAAGLEADARRIGRTLARLARPGTRVVLLFEDGLDYITGLFGCLEAGLVAVSGVHPAAPRSAERLLGILRDCGASVVLGQARVLAEYQRALDAELDDFDLRWVASDTIRPGPAASALVVPAAGDSLALIQYTSGSSRAPRGVMLTHRNILHNLQGQVTAFGYRSGDTGVSWLPFSHDMGLIGCVLMAIFGGGRCVLLSPSHFLEDPLRWLRAIARYRATLSGGPNFAYDLCARRAEAVGLGSLDLSCWTVAVSGAEPVRADVLRRFSRAFAPAGFDAAAIHPSYGLAEATLLVSSGSRDAPYRTRHLDKGELGRNVARPVDAQAPGGVELVGCGRGLPDQSLAIVDPVTLSPRLPGTIGEIWVAGPSVSKGYFDRPDDNSAYFTGDCGDGCGPYLRTGDLGFLLGGELYVTGRLRDLLVIRGRNYYPQDLEHSAETSHPALRPGCSACFLEEETDRLTLIAELARGSQDEAQAAAAAIRAAILRDHGLAPGRVLCCAAGNVLKTPSGKIQRAQTRTALAAGQIATLYESRLAVEPAAQLAPGPLPPRAPFDLARIEDWILQRMQRLGLDVATLDCGLKLAELGLDSIRIVELKADLERELGVAVPVADLYAFDDIGSLAGHLRREAARLSAPPHAETPVPTTPLGPKPQAAGNRLAEQRRLRRASIPSEAGAPLAL